ncbi:ImuA family protein [Pseudochryseolinea flava]|uniref:ImuA family protein n=1 Tax=Pseudochryseolinea flava TaxID=2059302 RepID=UPI00162507B1|nr:Error-prone repair protein ImuA [Pseudochryseolinea flava]
MSRTSKADIFAALQSDILRLQGFKPSSHIQVDAGLGPLIEAFPNATFPLGAVHEFRFEKIEDSAATNGFLSGLLSNVIAEHGTILWISATRTLFPPALKNYGLQPDRCIFIDLKNQKEVMWAMDEALKCGALSAVVGEVNEIDFTASRRLQLAVEKSQVTGFIILPEEKKINTTACVSRWKITALPSTTIDDLPGIGIPKWKVELLRIRNGKPGVWELELRKGKFEQSINPSAETLKRNTESIQQTA